MVGLGKSNITTGLLFGLTKWSRAIRIFFGGYKSMEEKYWLFSLTIPLTTKQIYQRLIPSGYQYNTMSTTYKNQIFTVRKLININHQIHLRFYSNGWVSGHYELQPDQWPLAHLSGRDLRPLSDDERVRIYELLVGYEEY